MCRWGMVLALLALVGIAPARAASARPQYLVSEQFPVLLLHGFNAGAAVDCANSAFPGVAATLHADGWQGPILRVGFYAGDTNCDVNLLSYQSACVNEYPGNAGTINEDLRHVACELAWYLWDAQSSHTDNTQIWGHSMSGLVVRWMLASLGHGAGLPGRLYVQDVVTSGTPHGGLPPGDSLIACGGCVQGAEMTQGSSFLQTLATSGQAPQATDGTDWTELGSDCDAVPPRSALAMTGAHTVEYVAPCYDHGGYITDADQALDATAWYSNGQPVLRESTTWPHSLHAVLLALASQNW